MRCHRVLRAALLLGAARGAEGQDVLRLSPQGNEVGIESRVEHWTMDGRSVSRTAWFGEWVSLSVSGMLVSPRVLSWSGSIRPYVSQQGGMTSTDNNALRNTGVSLGVNLLAGFPVSAALYVHDAGGQAVSATGGASDYRSATTGATLLWRNSALPVTVNLSRRATEDAWHSSPGAVPLRRDEALAAARIEARSSKMALVAERLRFVDRIGALDFESTSLAMDHTLRWGRGSWLATQLQSEHRDGSFANARSGGGLRLHVRHAEPTTSQLYVDRRWGDAAGIPVRQDAAGFELRNRVWDGVTVVGMTSWNRSAHGRTSQSTARQGSRVEVGLALPRGVRLAVTGAANLERVSRLLEASEWSYVFAESYRVEETRGFRIPVPGIDPSSIQVRSIDQTILYLRETDYTVSTGGGAVHIQILGGGRLAPGDVVLVDYRFEALDAGEHRVRGLAGDISLGTESVSLWMADGVRVADSDGAEGMARSLEGRDRTLGGTIRRRIGDGRVVIDATRRTRTRSVADVASTELHAVWIPSTSAVRRWSWGLRRLTSAALGNRLRSHSVDATFSWPVSSDLQLLASAERWLWTAARTSTERFFSVNGEANWRLGRIELVARYSFQQRVLVTTGDQHRVTFRAVRRF